MIVQVKTHELALMPLGTLFFDELTDSIPYRIVKVEEGKVYCNSLVSQNEILQVPEEYVVYLNLE